MPRKAIPLAMLYPLFFAAVYLSHLTLLRLPYFWDEGGYYIPAAWDFFRTGSLIPLSTATNAHPPLPSILLAGWWHLSGFVPSGTRTFVCMVAAAALLGVFRLTRNLLGVPAAVATTLLTAVYPIWFAQSTLAHADIFAAAFSLWGLSVYFKSATDPDAPSFGKLRTGYLASEMWVSAHAKVYAAALFSLAALSKETAIVTPAALALWEGVLLVRDRTDAAQARAHRGWMAALMAPALPLMAWYAYHYHRTGFIFGNPEFLRYNATANLDAYRIVLCLYHRFLHLTMHMNMFVPVTCAVAALFMPAIATRARLSQPVINAIAVILIANWFAFSILGGALLTRYLLPMYPLVLLVCVAEWQRRMRDWGWLAALSAAAFLAGIWINPPYAFAPEDNLTYRDMIVLHQRAVATIAQRWPQATVLTAWPAVSELERPELGYTKLPIKVFAIKNFSAEEVEKAATEPEDYDTALIFSTKWAPAAGAIDLSRQNRSADTRYFDFHEDVRPVEAAEMLHGDVVWEEHVRGEWVAILRFPRVEDASLPSQSPSIIVQLW
jgi:4-amino-4-deoxy-L-arabinose transferase-like glycosyltransferase